MQLKMNVNINTVDRVNSIQALKSFPYFLLRTKKFKNQSDYREELIEIQNYYNVYNKGASFNTEGTLGDYIPSQIHYKRIKRLIDKEARFLFSNTPEIDVLPLNSTGEQEENKQFDNHEKVINKVFEKSSFSKYLIQSAKDCFIGKRIAVLVDVSEQDGILLHFYNSLQFYYENDYGDSTITRFIGFECINKSKSQNNRKYIVKTYTLKQNKVYVQVELYDGIGNVIEEIIPETVTSLTSIPVEIITNDGTLDDKLGVSEVESLVDYESGYSRLGNADIDSERKGMNPIRYLVDMNSQTTKNLSSSAGSLWELKSEQNQDNVSPMIGVLAPAMNHTTAVTSTMDRLDNMMYDELDIPNIDEQTMSGVITSGKALKALYWPLQVRCEEKLKTWIPGLKNVVNRIIELAIQSPSIVQKMYSVEPLEDLPYTLNIEVDYALPDDEAEEMTNDLSCVNSNAMSRMSFFKKWRKNDLPTETDRQKELMQIAYENNLINMGGMGSVGDSTLVGNRVDEQIVEDETQNIIDNNNTE